MKTISAALLPAVAGLALGFLGGALLFSPDRALHVPSSFPRDGGEVAAAPELVPPAPPASSELRDSVAPGSCRNLVEEDEIPRSGSLVEGWRAEIRSRLVGEDPLDDMCADPSENRGLLFEICLLSGDVDRAEELLDEGLACWYWDRQRVAALRLSRGEVERATELYLQAFCENLDDEDMVHVVAELAPARALTFFADEEWDLDEEFTYFNDDLALNHALLLERAGRMAEAKELLLALLDDEKLRPDGFPALAALAPAEAEAILREQLVQPGPCGNPALRARARYLDFLETCGRAEVAVPFLFEEVNSASSGVAEDTHERLVRLAPARWRDHLCRELVEDEGDGELWARLGDCHAALGDESAALGLWIRALEQGEMGNWTFAAAARAPGRVLPMVRARIDGDDADEVAWYGDMCWSSGWREKARLAWQSALELDPKEEDWFNRLQRAALGRDPLSDAEDFLSWW